MANRPLRILQVSTADLGGGAEKVAWDLFRMHRQAGHRCWLAVGHRYRDDPDVLAIPTEPTASAWGRARRGLEEAVSPLANRGEGTRRVKRLLHRIARPRRLASWWRGAEDFDFPGSRQLLELPPEPPELVHGHNLHGGYFDLRALPSLSRQVPVVLTLHDAWLLSGHCAHSFDCARWQTGCGSCPDLTIYPAIRRDATAENWQRKREIYADSRLYVATPSRWLMRKVEQSMLMQGVVERRVIPNGVDLSVFHPMDRQAARRPLGLPQDARVLLFTSHGIRQNIWRDYATLRAAVAEVAKRLRGGRVLFIALGERGPADRMDRADIRFVPYQSAPGVVAQYYRAADVYIHAAMADTFPNTVLEALACGTPVVATAVGGIPEQVKGLRGEGTASGEAAGFGPDDATGVLIPTKDAQVMATGIDALLRDETLRDRLGRNAARDARERFDLKRSAADHERWYREILQRGTARANQARAKNAAARERG